MVALELDDDCRQVLSGLINLGPLNEEAALGGNDDHQDGHREVEDTSGPAEYETQCPSWPVGNEGPSDGRRAEQESEYGDEGESRHEEEGPSVLSTGRPR
jgi:hypothetical protein